MKHSEIRERALSNPQVKAAFDEVVPEFALLREVLHARQPAESSHAAVADGMGMEAPAATFPETPIPR